ncbi:MAG: isoprenylcysteine carboxyl methyltransferase [Myxococcota bacterium]|nr:isoprenylcysteine carboxyl methyltransferase [Myxococcota bacterium]
MPTPPPKTAAPEAQTTSLPPSVTHFGLNLIAIAIVLGAMYALRVNALHVANPVLFLCAALVIPIVAFDVLLLGTHRRKTTGIDWEKSSPLNWTRVVTKLSGLAATLAPLALAYWVFPEYRGAFYDPFYGLLKAFWPGLIATAILYFAFIDGHMREPRDAYWQLGRVVIGKWRDADKATIANHYRGWLIKGFFLALFVVWLNNSTHNVINYDLSNASWQNLRAYDFLYDFIFFIDLLLATVGYAMTFRAIDTHIRTAEPTMLGWVVALFCYEPFYSGLFAKQYIHYAGIGFGNWLAPHPQFRWAWGIGILILITIYVLATVAFGVRFSNLTHRGILTNGPYRYTKHPAYISKNLSWWMASVPFVVHDGVLNAIQRCLALGCLNFIYFMRARTEERHLSWDPTYVAYALWVNEHGTLAFLGRWLPILKYKPPAVPEQPRVVEAASLQTAAAGNSPES